MKSNDLAQLTCRTCGGIAEIDADQDFRGLSCPRCGKDAAFTERGAAVIRPPVVRVVVKALPDPIPSSPELIPANIKLRRCPDCGSEISLKAKACVKCGAPVPKEKGRFKVFWNTAAVIVFVLFVGWIFAPNPLSDSDFAHPSIAIDPELTTSRTELRIRNNDSFEWTPKTIFLNGPPPAAYRASVREVKAGETVRIPLIEFASKHGERFDPARTKVRKLWIGGGGSDYVGYEVRQ